MTTTPTPVPMPVPQSPASTIGHNSGTQTVPTVADIAAAKKADWLAKCAQSGEQAGAGLVSQIDWMQDVVERSYRGDIEQDWAKDGVLQYQTAKKKRAGRLFKSLKDETADLVERTSEALKLIKLGQLAQFRAVNNGGLGTFVRTLKVIADENIKGERVKMVLKVATEQLRKPDAPLDVDHIKQVLAPKESPDKTEGDWLDKADKSLEEAAKLSGWDAHKRAAQNSIRVRKEEINFKTAADRKAEAAAKATVAAAKKKASTKKKR